MGWTSCHAIYHKQIKQKGRFYTIVDAKKELDIGIFGEWKVGNSTCKVLKSAMYGSTYYGAIERINNDTQEHEVFAVVCLTSVDNSDYYNFSYKDMDETEHPFYYDCPESILKLLTPTDNENANKWREGCRRKAKKKKVLAKHEPIILTVSYHLTSGHKPGDRIKLHWWDNWGGNGYYTDGTYKYSTRTILCHGFEIDPDYQLTKKALDL